MIHFISAVALVHFTAGGALADCTVATQQFTVVETDVVCPGIVLPPTTPQAAMGKADILIESIRFQATNGQPRDRRFLNDVVNSGPHARVPRRGKATIEPETLCSIRAHATNEIPGANSFFRGSDTLSRSFAHAVRNAVRDSVVAADPRGDVWGTDPISAREMVFAFDATPASAFFLPVQDLDDNDNLGDYAGRATIDASVDARTSTVTLTYSQESLEIVNAASDAASVWDDVDIVHVTTLSYCGCTSTVSISPANVVVTTTSTRVKGEVIPKLEVARCNGKDGKSGRLVSSLGAASASSSAAPIVALVAAAVAVVVVAGFLIRRNRARAVDDHEDAFVVEHNEAFAL